MNPPPADTPLQKAELLELVLRMGSFRLVAAATVGSIVSSCLIAVLVMHLTGQNSGVPFVLFLAALIPALVAPTVTFWIVRMLFELNETRQKLQQTNTHLAELQRKLEVSHAELQAQHEQLEILAQRDALTGLFNRRAFAKLANLELARRQRHPSQTSIIMADLDFFKRVNDTYNHPAGDKVIQFMADAMLRVVRKTDVVARMGGEEFIVMLPETSMEQAFVVAEKLRAWLHATPITTDDGQVIPMTGSFGVTGLAAQQEASLDQLYAAADAALYNAKSHGRNRVETCQVNPDQ